MKKGAVQIAHELADAAERARLAGDAVASLALAVKATEYLQLAKLLEDSLATSPRDQKERT